MPAMVRSAALTGYAALTRELGLDPARLVAAVGLPEAALRDPELRIPASRVGRLYELSAAAADVEDFGLRLAETRDPSNLGLLAVAAREAPTLRAGVTTLARYMALHNESLSVRLEAMDGAWLVSPVLANRGGQPMRQSVELTMAVLHRTLGALFGADWRPEQVCLPHPAPRGASAHRRVFGRGHVQFDPPVSGLVCSEADMDRRRAPAGGAESLLARDARAYLEGLLARTEMAFPDRVRATVAWLLPEGRCSADTVAEQLGVDRRTLHRRLASAGCTYTEVLDEVRRDAARMLLAEGGRPMQGVAVALGFGAPSVFARWFRARFGCTATEWRRRT